MPDREIHLQESDSNNISSSGYHDVLIMQGLILAINNAVKETPNDQELGKKIRNLFNGKI
jgi:hypothetical protein